MWRHNLCEYYKREKAYRRAYQINHIEGEVVCYHAAHCHPNANAHIPSREICTRGCGALVVAGKVDIQGVHGGEHCAEPYAEQGWHLSLLPI